MPANLICEDWPPEVLWSQEIVLETSQFKCQLRSIKDINITVVRNCKIDDSTEFPLESRFDDGKLTIVYGLFIYLGWKDRTSAGTVLGSLTLKRLKTQFDPQGYVDSQYQRYKSTDAPTYAFTFSRRAYKFA